MKPEATSINVPILMWIIAFFTLISISIASTAHIYRTLLDNQNAVDSIRAKALVNSIAEDLQKKIDLSQSMKSQEYIFTATLKKHLDFHEDLQSIQLENAEGTTIFSSEKEKKPLSIFSFFKIKFFESETVVSDNKKLYINISLQKSGLYQLIKLIFPLIFWGCSLLSTIAALSVYVAQSYGPHERDRAFYLAIRDIEKGRYDRITLASCRRYYNLQVQRIARAVRAVHEILIRTNRLVVSLCETEPQKERRDWMERQIRKAKDRYIFAQEELGIRRVFSVDIQSAWIALLGGTAITVLILLSMYSYLHIKPMSTKNQVNGIYIFLSTAPCFFSTLVTWKVVHQLSGSIAWIILLAASLLAILVIPAFQTFNPLGIFAISFLSGVGNGLILGACESVHNNARHPPYGTSQKWAPGLLYLFWGLGMFSFGPMLGYLMSVLGPLAMAICILICVALLFFQLICCNLPNSPWRESVSTILLKQEVKFTKIFQYFFTSSKKDKMIVFSISCTLLGMHYASSVSNFSRQNTIFDVPNEFFCTNFAFALGGFLGTQKTSLFNWTVRKKIFAFGAIILAGFAYIFFEKKIELLISPVYYESYLSTFLKICLAYYTGFLFSKSIRAVGLSSLPFGRFTTIFFTFLGVIMFLIVLAP